MWFIGVEVEKETSAPPPKKKSWIRPWNVRESEYFKSPKPENIYEYGKNLL